ncbi:hypothetical protein B0H19DRAFT_416388 [Mycena capillaripes]|nr:hypothetical protein B0H19DRAFT_416388 [Mycena capillaripes]
MPRPPFAQSARAWIVNLRWLCRLLRQRLEGLPFALRFAILRLQIAAKTVRDALLSYPRNRNAYDPGFLPYRLADQDGPIPPSMLPPERSLDIILAESPDAERPIAVPDAGFSNDADLERSSCPNSGIESGSATFMTSTPTDDTFHTLATPSFSLRLIFPEDFQRYQRKTILREKNKYTIEPQTFTFEADDAPPGWIVHLHPEGARYFSHPGRRIYTDINLCDEENLANINRVVEQVVAVIRASGKETDPHYAALFGGVSYPEMLIDLVIDEIPNETEPSWGYYFVNHSERCPFWLHPIQADYLLVWNHIHGPIENEQLRHAMECQYWQHCAMFPNALKVTDPLMRELRDTIVYSIGDVSTSATSTVSRSIEELRHLQSAVEHIQDGGLGSSFTIARTMDQFAYDRFLNFHGLPHARLSRDQSVYDREQPAPSLLFRAASHILFYGPEVYLQSLKKAYTDQSVITRVWKPLIDKLNTEWQDFAFLATVILNANVSFLSITTVDTLNPSGRHPAVQILSYLSIVASIGSIILSLLLIRQNRTKFHETADQISTSVDRRTSKKFGLELLALIFALPYALLMWSMVLFFAALMAACLRVPDTVARSMIGAAAGIMVLLVCWCIWDAWDMDHELPFGFVLRERIRSAFQSMLSLAANESLPAKKTGGLRIRRLFSGRVEVKDGAV